MVAPISKVFEVAPADDKPDLTEMIFSLSSVQEPFKLFAEIMMAITEESARNNLTFMVHLSHLQDRLDLGMQYDLNPRDLGGIEKIVGRDTNSLLRSLADDQKEVLCLWQQLALQQVAENSNNDSLQEDIRRMAAIHAWLSRIKDGRR